MGADEKTLKIKIDTKSHQEVQKVVRTLSTLSVDVTEYGAGTLIRPTRDVVVPVYLVFEDDKQVDAYIAINEIELGDGHMATHKEEIIEAIKKEANKADIRCEGCSHIIDAPAQWWLQLIDACDSLEEPKAVRDCIIGWLGGHMTDRDLDRSYIDWPDDAKRPVAISIQGIGDQPPLDEFFNIVRSRLSDSPTSVEFLTFCLVTPITLAAGSGIRVFELSNPGMCVYDAEGYIREGIVEIAPDLDDFMLGFDGIPSRVDTGSSTNYGNPFSRGEEAAEEIESGGGTVAEDGEKNKKDIVTETDVILAEMEETGHEGT